MSVLQRVDRELNTSLDLDRTMRISLDWAMRQSQAEAGMIGHLDEGEGGEHIFSVVASRGYTVLPTSNKDTGGYSGPENRPRLALPEHISAAIRRGQAVQLDTAAALDDESTGQPGLLEGGRSAIVVPIQRQGAIIALILMESPRWSAFSEETLVFLSRLSDHAAIAITNARLYADLQAANIAKSEYVSLVSHELKTPMTSIRGYTDLLSQGVVGEINDSQANFLSTIRTNVGRMATLVSDLADVSRIEADRLRLEFSAVDIGQVIDEVSHSQKALIDEKNQELRVDLPADVPAVWGDQHRLVQILTNLVSNANKYTPREGSIEISAEVSPNTWDPEGAPQVVHVRVIDNGYGISEEDRKKIFQKFFRSDAQNIRDAPGTGLGLNIARHLVEMQGGRIWFESEIGSGSVFQFTVPVAATG
jgi:signal transduction histidine kinase